MSPSTDAAVAQPPAAAAPPAPRRLRHIPELLEIHADELAYLWGQRRQAMFDPRHTLVSFVELNDRVAAHLAGLLVARAALPALLQPRLEAAEDRDDAFAAALGLLRLESASARVVETFATAEGALLLGLRDALCAAPLAGQAAALHAALEHADAAHAVAAASALAMRRMLPREHPRLDGLLLHDDAAIAAQAWRAVLFADHAQEQRPPRPFGAALRRDEPLLRDAVLAAAAWSSQPRALDAARHLAGHGCPVALGWWAALASPEDGPALFAAAQALPPPQRAALFGRWGDPRTLPWLLQAMHGDDVPLAAAALAAYERITGAELRGARVVPPLHEGASDFDREMAAPVWLPDRAALDAHHARHAAQWAEAPRWNRGLALGAQPDADALRRVDLPARWDAGARAALQRQALLPPPPPV